MRVKTEKAGLIADKRPRAVTCRESRELPHLPPLTFVRGGRCVYERSITPMLYIVQTALEAGALYAPVALALFLSYSILDIADLTTDGSFTLGCAVSAMVCLAGHPILAIPAAMAAAAAAGFITAFLQTKLAVPSILAGIVTNIGLYTVNLMVMGSSNRSIFRRETIFSLAEGLGLGSATKLVVCAVVVLAMCCLLYTSDAADE